MASTSTFSLLCVTEVRSFMLFVPFIRFQLFVVQEIWHVTNDSNFYSKKSLTIPFVFHLGFEGEGFIP